MNSRAQEEERSARALVSATARGSREEFSRLYRMMHPTLIRFACRYLRNAQDCEEVVNDTMLVVWQKAATFRGDSRVSTWILGIALRKCRDVQRRVGSEPPRADEEPDALSAPGIADELDRNQMLQRAIAALSAEHRATIEMCYGYGYSCEEIAKVMECPVNTVKTRLHFARKYLRSMIGDAWDAATPAAG